MTTEIPSKINDQNRLGHPVSPGSGTAAGTAARRVDPASTAAALSLLERRLQTDPSLFRDLFISDGMAAVAGEFRQEELSEEFTLKLWDTLLGGGDAATVLQRFLWQLPLKKKKVFLAAVDTHLSQRYPMFAGLSDMWPTGNGIHPYIRPADERAKDFELVNKGYLGYQDLGYSLREVELFVWLEALRDRQCAKTPCQLGELNRKTGVYTGGCPVQVNISTMFELIGEGKFDQALELLEGCNPLPDVTGRVCPQELQCQGSCIHKHPMSIGQVEWFLPEWDKLANPDAALKRYEGTPDPWQVADKAPVAIVGSGPSGLITAFLLARHGVPVTVFEAFHELGGVLRYGIPEFRLPNVLIDDVVAKIRLLGGRFVTNFVVGKTATLQELEAAGFTRIFVGSGAGLPQFLNVPGEHLLGVMSANEFLTRVNLMQAHRETHETPLPPVAGKNVLIIGGGNTAMDAARTAKRLGGNVTIVYRRTREEMPARVEELHHALEEGIALATLRSPSEFKASEGSPWVATAVVDIMELGEADESGRRRPINTGESEEIGADLVIMALGNSANPIIKDSEPRLLITKRGGIELREGSQETTVAGIYSGGDAARGGSTAIRAAGDGRTAAYEIAEVLDPEEDVAQLVARALAYTDKVSSRPVILEKRNLSHNIEELVVFAPAIASAARAGQFVRVLPYVGGELIPLTLADWDAAAGTITLAVQQMGTSSTRINRMTAGDALAGIAGPLGQPSELHKYADDETVVFTAGGLGLPPVYPIMREHLRLGNHVTLIAGFRSKDLMFWTDLEERVPALQAEFGDKLEVVYATNDGTYGVEGFVTTPLEPLLAATQDGTATRKIAEVVTIGPPLMMRSVSDLTKRYGVKCVASLNSIMVDATGMCGACMVPVNENGKLVRKHACIDGPELDSHSIDWDKFLPRFSFFKAQEQASKERAGLV
ncbi:MAG: sulfide/dihydroorotate dehydrogenase-like FAD/NAD-binding protein [Propionibacteriaceae bacterium]|jgi:glutamate synthase (NADPH/NADH) small chain|nr:sulfide/dihydroorotate dehydrogenase-like FAD/NAD-binding protein [Propionibacteriaceae bacterium]